MRALRFKVGTLARTRPALTEDAALEVEDLAVIRGGRSVFAAVSFRLGGGEALAVSGRNGAGKSTLLRALAGWLPLAAGRIRLAGLPDEPVMAERVHYLGHADGLKGALTAGENLAVTAAVLGSGHGQAPAGPRAPADALDRLGLAHLLDIPVAYLSAGQRRRVALARLLVAPRLVWLLDEPTTALDGLAREALAAMMTAHRAAGGMIVAATHAPLGLDAVRELRLAPAAP